MNERFQGDNNRNLQGAQLGIRASAPGLAIDSFNVGLLGAKLATADHEYVEQLKASYPFIWGDFDRILYGGRADVTFLKGADLGLTFLQEKDLKSTFDSSTLSTEDRNSAQSGTVVAFRLGGKADKFTDMGPFTAALNAEIPSLLQIIRALGGAVDPQLMQGFYQPPPTNGHPYGYQPSAPQVPPGIEPQPQPTFDPNLFAANNMPVPGLAPTAKPPLMPQTAVGGAMDLDYVPVEEEGPGLPKMGGGWV